MKKRCTKLFAHSLTNLETVGIDAHTITKVCTTCGYREVLPRSDRRVLFVNNLLLQNKQWAADDNRKELLQPLNYDGSVNTDFTEAFGFNPNDDRTKLSTPRVQGGMA